MTIDGLSEPLGLTVLQSWYQLRSSLFGPAPWRWITGCRRSLEPVEFRRVRLARPGKSMMSTGVMKGSFLQG